MRLHQISGAKMSRLIGNIGGSDIVEDDDGSVTFLGGRSSMATAPTASSVVPAENYIREY
jgi:hypothetical protein